MASRAKADRELHGSRVPLPRNAIDGAECTKNMTGRIFDRDFGTGLLIAYGVPIHPLTA